MSRGHPGHQPAGHLALVEVEAEPLQLREDLDPQGEQQPLAVAADHHRLRDVRPPSRRTRGQPDDRHGHDHVEQPRLRCPGRSPPRTARASRARRARRARRAQPGDQRDRIGRSSLLERELGSRPPDLGLSTSGLSVAGGSASTLASSSGLAARRRSCRPLPAGRIPPPRPPARPPPLGTRLAAAAAACAESLNSGSAERSHSAGGHAVDPGPSSWSTGSEPASTPSASSPGPDQQQPVERAVAVELLGRADRDEPPAVEHRDPVGELQGGAAVRDQQRRAVLHHPVQGGVDLGLGGASTAEVASSSSSRSAGR
jgi:hypothetical protein